MFKNVMVHISALYHHQMYEIMTVVVMYKAVSKTIAAIENFHSVFRLLEFEIMVHVEVTMAKTYITARMITEEMA